MKTVAVVPMKLNNQRLPGKNTKPFSDGTPLCSCILNTLCSVKDIDEVYVYCSSAEIKQYLPYGVKFLSRSTSLDSDTTTMNDVLKCFAQNVNADVYVLTHATAPFIKCSSIQKGILAVKENGYDSAFAAKKVQEFLWQDGKPINYDVKHIPRTQDLPLIFAETCGLYVYKKHLIIEQNRRIGDNPFIVEVGGFETIDIDEADDFVLADTVHALYKEKMIFNE